MLVEIKDVRQVPGEGRRRWFTDSELDLIVWYEGDEVSGFQLCYGKPRDEHALTWHRPASYAHTRVDDGEGPWGSKMTPVLVQDGLFQWDAIARHFKAASTEIDPEISALVYNSLAEYPLATSARAGARPDRG
jgi:hypothetical protein